MTNTYPVMEQFYTIQGEGKFAGAPAYFIRLAGCDVGCVWCDVKESWNASDYPYISTDELTNQAVNSGCKIVVITGGEPAMYNLSGLTTALHKAGLKVHIETSAAYPIVGSFDWVTISPKKFKPPVKSELEKANELKIVIFNKSDFEWAETYASEVGENALLYLQPEWDKREIVLPQMIDFVKQNPKWNLSLQTHKYIGVP